MKRRYEYALWPMLTLLGVLWVANCTPASQRRPLAAPGPMPDAPDAAVGASPDASLVQGAAGEPKCEGGLALKLDLERWKDELRAARKAERRNELLANMGFDPVPDQRSEGGNSPPVAPKLVELELIPLAMTSDSEMDRGVYLRYQGGDGPMPVQHVRFRVLTPKAHSYWCRIGEPMSADQSHRQSACLGVDPYSPPIVVEPVRLVDEKRDALQVVRQYGKCGGCGRSGTHKLEYFVLKGRQLASVLVHTLYHATYSGCPFPPVKVNSGSISLEGGFPRTIIKTTEISCSKPDHGLPAKYREVCVSKKSVDRYTWNGQRFESE